MKPFAILMIEHRLIERMIALLKEESQSITNTSKIDLDFIKDAIDFLNKYADIAHHGKEEEILFKKLKNKNIFKEYQDKLSDLLNEHVIARNNIQALNEAVANYDEGNSLKKEIIKQIIETIINLYSAHIEKEDKHFFIPVMDYFTQKEQEIMLKELIEFDKNKNLEIYKFMIEKYEQK